MPIGLFAVASILALTACSDDTIHLQPGQHYTIRKDFGVTPCPGIWDDYERVQNASSNTDRLRIVLGDGGTTLIGGDSFTVVGFGPGLDAPVRIRSNVNNALCWLPNDDIQEMIRRPD